MSTAHNAEIDALADALADEWAVFRSHRPVGAYLPVGQLDGDCKCGRGAWPCATVREALARVTPPGSGEPR